LIFGRVFTTVNRHMKRRSNAGVRRAVTDRFREARLLWRGVRDPFAREIHSREPLPLLVGGVQRGVVRAWFTDSTKPAVPRAGTLLKVLGALGIDEAPYREYLEHVGPGEAAIRAVCPNGHPWSTTKSSLDRANRRQTRRGLPPMPQRSDGSVEWLCARCVRGTIGRANFQLINRPGRTRGRDRRPRRRNPKTEEHRKRIASGHIARALLRKRFRFCPLCGLIRYDREWHQLCWLAWRWYCWRRGLDPAKRNPPIRRRPGPDSVRRLKRNYEFLIRNAVGGVSWHQILADARLSSKIGPASRRGRRYRLGSPEAILQAARAFLDLAPGAWSMIFSRTHRTALREAALPLPSSLHGLVASGARDSVIMRLHSFEMRPDNIARVTGASVGHVRSVIRAMGEAPVDSIRPKERQGKKPRPDSAEYPAP
jgi:hypothetical protein